jgi:hypothetical protein
MYILHDAIETIAVGEEAVVAELMLDDQQNHDAARHANGEAGDVDEGISSVLEQISKGDFEVAFKHSSLQT